MIGIFAAFIIALGVAILFSPYKRNDSLMPLMILFFVLFFAGLASQFWIVPFGPVFMGVAWLRTLFIVFLFALLFSAQPIHRKSNSDNGAPEHAVFSVGTFVWVLIVLLLVSIAVGLFYGEPLLAGTPAVRE